MNLDQNKFSVENFGFYHKTCPQRQRVRPLSGFSLHRNVVIVTPLVKNRRNHREVDKIIKMIRFRHRIFIIKFYRVKTTHHH